MSISIGELTPESLLIVKEAIEQELSNPCIGCIHEFTENKYWLEYCHYRCKE